MADAELYITAAEAAAELGVSRATLYAYVSRRGIRTKREPGARESLYWKSDILKAKQKRGPIAPEKSPSRDYVETALTFMTDKGPYYRGISAIDAADSLTLEDVAARMWDLPVDSLFTPRLPKAPQEFAPLLDLVGHLGVTDRAAALLPLMEGTNPRSYDLSAHGMALTGADVLRTMTAILLRTPELSDEPAHIRIAATLGISDFWADVVRRLLILSADNGLEAGTYVVRAAASAGITPYRSVLTGIVVSAGRRQKFGRIDGLARLLEEILAAGDAEEPVIRRIREGEALPGFNSSLYPGGDPRAVALLDRLAADLSDDPEFRALRTALAVAEDALGQHPDFALLTMFVNRKIGLDQRDSCFFLGRSVGWIAHAIEQFSAGRFHRPPLVYTGPLPEG
ncbi:MAG: hypothetical protein IE932_00110 [Sphingopyxis terrae]|nr:hypothetical protein [Sphingopyxis terrae]